MRLKSKHYEIKNDFYIFCYNYDFLRLSHKYDLVCMSSTSHYFYVLSHKHEKSMDLSFMWWKWVSTAYCYAQLKL